MLSLALTGNVAAGKSTVAALLEAWGAIVLDADRIVRELQQPGTPVFRSIVDRFGQGIVTAEGTLDRAALRARIVSDPGARAALEHIVHPAVEHERRARLAAAERGGARVAISDIPLLFESGDPSAFAGVILVDAPEAERRRRLVEDRGLDPAEADRLMAIQLPASLKRPRSDWIIENGGDLAALEAGTRAVWSDISRRAADPS